MPDRLPPTPTLESDRLVLRPLRMEDAPVIGMSTESELGRFFPAPSVPERKT